MADGGAGGGGGSGGVVKVAFGVETVATKPYDDQKPGTSGLRKKTRVFLDNPNYLENFIQATFDTIGEENYKGKTLVVSGDGRFFTIPAAQRIVQMCAGVGVGKVVLGRDALLSTPAVSALIRNREDCFGGLILTASHNPGGAGGDFGVKFNPANGGPAPSELTDAIFERSKALEGFVVASGFPTVEVGAVGKWEFEATDGEGRLEVEVVDCAEEYVAVLRECFDMEAIRALLARPDFTMVFDAMHGVTGPYAKRVLVEELGADPSCVLHGTPLEDFGKLHPDPNLTYASDLVERMGLLPDGTPAVSSTPTATSIPDFGAASDGDGDRAMFLGKGFFVSPSDSLAVLAANANAIKMFRGGLRGVARSMPTSAALDTVVRARNEAAEDAGVPAKTHLFVVPTGWKFFCSLMDSGPVHGKTELRPFLCGEESFGTGSSHVREKDGLWAVLAWLSVIAYWNADSPVGELIPVEGIVRTHWREFGRHFYRRLDFEGVDKDKAEAVMTHLRSLVDAAPEGADRVFEFDYTDHVTGAEAKAQGIVVALRGGGRIVYRLSGTGSEGATIRIYVEQYTPPGKEEDDDALNADVGTALKDVIQQALQIANMRDLVGRTEPDVVT